MPAIPAHSASSIASPTVVFVNRDIHCYRLPLEFGAPMIKTLYVAIAIATATLAAALGVGAAIQFVGNDASSIAEPPMVPALTTDGTAAGASDGSEEGSADSGPSQAEPGSDPNTSPDASSPQDAQDSEDGEVPVAPAWNPLGAIHPGIQTFTDGAQCTANFVFYDAADIYIGQAAHCAGTGAATDTNGCTADSLPLGTTVDLGTSNDGVLVYSSWIAMQDVDTPSTAPECYGNDFALIKVAEADEGDVSQSVPFFGGPTAVGPTAGLGVGDQVYSFGNSGLRFGVEPVLSWKHGTVIAADAWSADLYSATPGIPGDSGSAFMDADGRAIGVLSTVALAPFPLSNAISGLESALAYEASHGGPAVQLATAPWVGGLV